MLLERERQRVFASGDRQRACFIIAPVAVGLQGDYMFICT